MARRTKPQSTSPNLALVIFLAIFVVLNIGFGGWVYMLYKDRDKWDSKAKEKEEELKYARQTLEWTKYQRDELLAAVGGSELLGKAEEIKKWKDNREPFVKSPIEGPFKGEDGDVEFQKVIKGILEDRLGGFEDGYKSKFAGVQKPLLDKLATVQGKYLEERRNNEQQQKALLALQAKYNKDREDLESKFNKGNKEALDARIAATQTMKDAIAQNEALLKKNADDEAKAKFDLDTQRLLIVDLKKQVESQIANVKNPNRTVGEPHALVLDISKGKPLWDVPRGKIVRVDDSGKKIFIDRGTKDGVKPGLTFNVFAAGWNGRGEGDLKATIEVVRVEDERTSVCKVITVYDTDGHEISVTDATPARLLREGANVLREGDLLFNLCWGTHVAIVGIVDLGSSDAKSPAGQMDNLKEFIGQLQRLGVTVDAYTDLRDGNLVGDLTDKTNYLIRGSRVRASGESDDARAKAINSTIADMYQRATERGLFVINPQNFAVVGGFRRVGDDGLRQTLTFVPGRPGGAEQQSQPAQEQQKKGQ